jgi:hypothetical protein
VDVVAEVERGNQSHEKKADDYHEGASFHVDVGWLPPDWRGHAGMVAWRGRMARGCKRLQLRPPGARCSGTLFVDRCGDSSAEHKEPSCHTSKPGDYADVPRAKMSDGEQSDPQYHEAIRRLFSDE